MSMTVAPHGHEPWTFWNNGPVTTTFTPAPTCLGTDQILLGTIGTDNPYIMYSVQCDTTSFANCVPSATTTPFSSTDVEWASSVGSYYSPGLYCPSGWETVAQAGRDGDKSYTTSGAMSFASKERVPYFDYMPTLLASILQPSETVVLCCPSDYTADIFGGCYNTVASYTPTQACNVEDNRLTGVARSTAVYPVDGTKTKEIVSVTTTVGSITTYTKTWASNNGFANYYTPFHYVTAVTLIHHESDIHATGSAGATSTGAAESANKSADSTSNAATNLSSSVTGWNGLGAVLSASVAATILGAAILL